MTSNHQDGRGAIFKNAKKEKDTHPDYRGDLTIEGRKFWVSGWIKDSKGGKFLSLALRPAEGEHTRNGQRPAQSAVDDAIPF
jgi:hypothetical protein